MSIYEEGEAISQLQRSMEENGLLKRIKDERGREREYSNVKILSSFINFSIVLPLYYSFLYGE